MSGLLLDLFAGVGGAAKGYHDAGFDIVGVDKIVQPEYPYRLFRRDALEFARQVLLDDEAQIRGEPIVAVHASPPCKKFSTLSKSLGYDSHTDLLTPMREILHTLDLRTRKSIPWIIENVPGAPMKNPIILCGSMFGLKIEAGYLQRHRLFESNIMLEMPGPCRHDEMFWQFSKDELADFARKGEWPGTLDSEGRMYLKAMGVYGNGRGGGELKNRTANADQARRLMGIDWAGRGGVAQAVPPAYTKYLGEQLQDYIERNPRVYEQGREWSVAHG